MRKDFLPCTEHSYSATEMAQETGSPAPSRRHQSCQDMIQQETENMLVQRLEGKTPHVFASYCPKQCRLAVW